MSWRARQVIDGDGVITLQGTYTFIHIPPILERNMSICAIAFGWDKRWFPGGYVFILWFILFGMIFDFLHVQE